MGKLFFASLFTLVIIFSFVAGGIILILIYTENINLGLAIGLTLGINFILWLVGPFFTDLINKWFYKVNFLKKEDLIQQHPEIAGFIEQISSQYHFSFPKVGIIPDKNPTAFTYGSGRFNARLVLTEGLLHFLNPQEVKAVVAHEMGHIVHRDFIVMMIASTLIQILYEIYFFSIRMARKNNKEKNKFPALAIALISYVFYIIGIYLVFYLSRTREYLADAFSAKFTQPKDLANALIKIAYGIVTAEDDNSSKRLLQSTRHLGIIDVKNAKHYGVISYITQNNPDILAEVMVFDKINPWAKLTELNSTHPLTGKRISHLDKIAKIQGQPLLFNVEAAEQRLKIDKKKLYGDFFFELLIALLPYILVLAGLFFIPPVFLLAIFALGLILQLPYKFPFGEPIETTILEQMRNPYASPIKGKLISLSGRTIGRGIPGYIFSEDMMYQDSTGLIFLNYTSALGSIGNLFFALTKIKKLLGAPSRAIGWFYRGLNSTVSLKYLQTEQEKIASHPALWAFILPVILVIISFYLYFSGDSPILSSMF